MKDITAVLITVNRAPSKNYLFDTLGNLKRGGVLKSDHLSSFHICDSGGSDPTWCVSRLPDSAIYHFPHEKPRTATENTAFALRTGALKNTKWVLFLEDDIDVCENFLESISDWLDVHARDDRRVYPLGADYGPVLDAYKAGKESWEYPIEGFYGTQAFVIRSEDALDLSNYLTVHHIPVGYDLLMHGWAQKRYPDILHFLTPAPSFVEHTGRESVIQPRAYTHTFIAWAGRRYSYQSKVAK